MQNSLPAVVPDQWTLQRVSTKITLRSENGSQFQNVVVGIKTPQCVSTSVESLFFPVLEKEVLLVSFTLQGDAIPSSATVTVCANYFSTESEGEPRYTEVKFNLPFLLFFTPAIPIRDAAYKIIVDTNYSVAQLTEQLFEECILTTPLKDFYSSSTTNVISFRFTPNPSIDFTVVGSKNSGRYRIQSSTFVALQFGLQELARRLKSHFNKSEDSTPVQITFNDDFPLEPYFETIEVHLLARKALETVKKMLEKKAVQYRSVQKRLLVRYKDKNAVPLQSFDLLSEMMHKELMTVANQVEEAQRNLAQCNNNLSCSTWLFLNLIRYSFHLSDQDFEVLRAHLNPELDTNSEQGWEEQVSASLESFLKTVLTVAPSSDPLQIPVFEPIEDTSKLKKQLGTVYQRFSKGLAISKSSKKKKEMNASLRKSMSQVNEKKTAAKK
jgi:Bardet-Biedl syndrome 9 protein